MASIFTSYANAARMTLNELFMVIGDRVDMGHSWKDDFPSPSEPGERVGNNTPNPNLQVTGHHFSVDRDRGPSTGLAQISTVIKRVMVINRKSIQDLLPQFLFKINSCLCPMGSKSRDQSNLLI
jgi:hypothetical protein